MGLLDEKFDISEDQLFESFIKNIVRTYFDDKDNEYIFIHPKRTIKNPYIYKLMIAPSTDNHKKVLQFKRVSSYCWVTLSGWSQYSGKREPITLFGARMWFENQELFENYYEPIRR